MTTTDIKVLIVVASRHGGTRGIAEAIARQLHQHGMTVDLRDAAEISAVVGYDAVIVGSAVYMGSWLGPAREFVEHNREALVRLPVWLFSSGPLDHDSPQAEAEPSHLKLMMAETGARGHRIFAGRLDRHALGLGERVVARAVKAPEGDFREWDKIRAWADQIAVELAALPQAVLAESDRAVERA